MNKWIKIPVTILIAVLILLGGSGISLAKMVCLKSGYTEISLNTPDDCCAHEHEHVPVRIEEKCCDISNMNVDLQQFITSNYNQIVKTDYWLPVAFLINFDFFTFSKASLFNFKTLNADPDLSGPLVRILIQSFQI
jgi:hypothetical protein